MSRSGKNVKAATAESPSDRDSELRYRTLFDLVPVAVYSTDAEGVIREFNRRATELWGREPDRKGEKFCAARLRSSPRTAGPCLTTNADGESFTGLIR
jgi:PAS domain-containing protein